MFVMPRQPRLDAPGALHHVMGRGIERTTIFRTDQDREDFLNRLADLCMDGNLIVYAWSLLSNHFHLLVRTGRQPISKSMKKLLTGYVVNFNLRHKRSGHLFQNRYKSIICEDDPVPAGTDEIHSFESVESGDGWNMESIEKLSLGRSFGNHGKGEAGMAG